MHLSAFALFNNGVQEPLAFLELHEIAFLLLHTHTHIHTHVHMHTSSSSAAGLEAAFAAEAPLGVKAHAAAAWQIL
jgi:hypothetical protein